LPIVTAIGGLERANRGAQAGLARLRGFGVKPWTDPHTAGALPHSVGPVGQRRSITARCLVGPFRPIPTHQSAGHLIDRHGLVADQLKFLVCTVDRIGFRATSSAARPSKSMR
jgi:hypothetical protein